MSINTKNFFEIINILKEFNNAKLVAISKKQSVENIINLYKLGQKEFGENYLQEAIKKIEEIKNKNINDILWHFTGQIQSKKCKDIVKYFDYVETVSSIKVANLLNKHSILLNKNIKILVQINIDKEINKAGINPDKEEILIFIKNIIDNFSNINLQGFMCIPKSSNNELENAKSFQKMNEILSFINQELNLNLKELSMGMSKDYKNALENNATIIRVGTKLFGLRI